MRALCRPLQPIEPSRDANPQRHDQALPCLVITEHGVPDAWPDDPSLRRRRRRGARAGPAPIYGNSPLGGGGRLRGLGPRP